MHSLSSQDIFAKLYDLHVHDWPGELDFYSELAAEPLLKAHGLPVHPASGQRYRKANCWTYDPATQIATNHIQWEQVDEKGATDQTWPMAPMRLRVFAGSVVEELLYRAGYTIEAVYGDFFKGKLADCSEQMIWVGRNTTGEPE